MKWHFVDTGIGDTFNGPYKKGNIYKVFFTGDKESLRVDPTELEWHKSQGNLPVKDSRMYGSKSTNIHIKHLQDDFASGTILEQVVNINPEHFYTMYPWSYEIYRSHRDFIDQQVRGSGKVIRDLKGHSMTPHFDNRFVMANLIINLADNKDGTVFYKYGSSEIIFKAPLGVGEGVFFFNNPFTRHNITVDHTEERFIFLGSYTLQIGAYRPVIDWVKLPIDVKS